MKKYPALRFHLGRKAFDRAAVSQGAKFSLPPAVQSGTASVGNLVLQRFMNGFGEQTVAAITTAYRVDSLLILPIVNFGSGIATIVAQNIGAEKQERAKKVLKTGAVMISVVSLFLTAVILFAGGTLIKMFGLTEESAAIGESFFRTIAVCYIIYGLAMAVRGYLEGTLSHPTFPARYGAPRTPVDLHKPLACLLYTSMIEVALPQSVLLG